MCDTVLSLRFFQNFERLIQYIISFAIVIMPKNEWRYDAGCICILCFMSGIRRPTGACCYRSFRFLGHRKLLEKLLGALQALFLLAFRHHELRRKH